MDNPTFRVKPYAHPKYKFVVRAKVGGKWKRSYFRSESEAAGYARKQNALSRRPLTSLSDSPRPFEAHNKVIRQRGLDVSMRQSARQATLARNAVVILGMHRSGTSALGGALNILGLDFGKTLAPPGKDNEKGYWENPEIVTLHDELLRLLNSRWDDDAPLPANWVLSGVAQEIQLLLLGVLERDFSGLSLFGLKDPRMCRLMPLWFPIFETLRIQPHFVLSSRHPWEVVQSLTKRDKLDPARSYLLWLEHTLEAEAATRGFPRSFVSYEGLIERPVPTLTRLCGELDLRLSPPSHAADGLSEFLAPSLRHHHSKTGAEATDASPPLVREVYEAMSAEADAAEISSRMSALGEQFQRGGALFFPRLNAIEAQIAGIDQQILGEGEPARRENLVRLQIFHPAADGYDESDSETRYFAAGSWALLTIELPGTADASAPPLRIDPASYPAVIDIAEMAMKRAATGEILWSATSENGFAGFEVGGTACRISHARYLRILSFGADPQLLLPPATVPLLEIPMRLELLVLVDNRPETISSSVMAIRNQGERRPVVQEQDRFLPTTTGLDPRLEQLKAESETWEKTFVELKRSLEISNAQAGRIAAESQARAEELDARQSEISTLQTRVATLTRDNLELASQLEAEHRHGAEQVRHRAEQTRELRGKLRQQGEQLHRGAEQSRKLSEQINVAATAAAATNKELEISRAEARRLLASSQLWKARVEGARFYEAQRTQQLKTVAADLSQTASALRSDQEDSSSIFDSIFAAIERIHHPSFWWKAMELLGFLRLMPPGAPRTTAERRAIAVELKAGLREIDKALSSKRLPPEEAASDIRRLFELRHRAHAIALSLRFPKILSGKSHPWTFIPWTGRTRPVVSRNSPAAVLVDAAWYLGEYPDIAAAGLDPLTHYLKWGVREQRNPNPLFNTVWYGARNPDVVAEGVNPLEHYVLRGAAEGRDPSPLFSTSWYLRVNPDVVGAGANPLQHYLEHGIREGRNPHPLFETAYYLAQAPEAEGANPVEHYLKGGGWDASPHPLFDTKWYFEQHPDVAAGKVNPLLHYLDAGAREGRDPHPLFDSSWYLDVNPDVRANGINPLVHYLAAGSEEGRDPHPLFDVSWYRARYFAHLAPGYDPLSHYLKKGWRENLDPHPLFDTSRYLAENGDVAAHGVNPLVHFQIGGGIEGRDPHPLFDSSWYLESNPEVREERMNPLSHYLSVGAKRGRDPHPLFQTKHYCEQRRAHEFRAGELSERSLRSSTRKGSSKTKGQKGVIYAFTSICLNYVPKAIVLARTLKKYNPDLRFCVLVSDRIPQGALDAIDVFDEVITIEELDIANKPSWIFRHTVVELCTAVKGYFIVDLLEREDCAAAFYFDPDIVCFSPLDVLNEKLTRASILLTPHLTDPEVTDEAIRDNEICALKHGVYNLGFLGLRPSPEGRRFARWWRDRLRDFCRADIPGGLFTDQRWVDLAPALFRELEIVRHPGCNAATWNLTNRHIEGDFTTGFTVNGEPLIFYHFSGFDSGAQGAMLDKYGGEMPSAQLLRKWYEEETAKPGEARFNEFPWTLGSFSNGEPISNAQRILYRDRQDLQNAFPNPFDASSPGHSYYHWYHSEVLGKPLDPTGANYNPLVEFVEEQAPLSPNPFFDCNWYLQRNPDVVAAGINPLVHFVLAGANEGRSPNPNFFPVYYREQLGPDERSENPLAHYILHGQKEGRRTDPRFDSTTDAPLRNRIRRWAKSGPPLILLISHYGGGGTEKHLRDLADSVQGQAKFLQLTPGHDRLVRLFPRNPDLSSKLVFDPAQQFDVLVEVIQEFEPQRIHIHHILGNEEYLAALVDRLNLPFDFTIHDYYVLAPSPHLVGGDGRFVGDDLEAHQDELLAASIARRRPTSLSAWQNAHNWLVTDADRVIVPSRDVAHRVSRFFPAVRPIVSAHPEAGKAARKITFPSVTPADTFRVALLGDFLRHKGKDTFLECAKIVRSSADKISFELIGDAYDDSQLLREAGVWVSGRYEEEDVLALLAQRRPHLLWYPAICPESYSYTLSVGLESGIPLVVTDLGSLPERVAGRPWAWVCPWEYTAADWISFFRRIRERNFLAKLAPKTPAGINPVTSSFYPADYLAVLPAHRTCKEEDTESQLALAR